MTPTNPLTTSRKQLHTLLKGYFDPKGCLVQEDRLHRSVGRDGKTRIGVNPVRESPYRQSGQASEFRLQVQFYGPWKDQINNLEVVNPTWIETQAEIFKDLIRTGDPHQDDAWFYRVEEITYPDDPTGNATRFEAVVTAFGTNTALLETVG
jgi:hypothetical protein